MLYRHTHAHAHTHFIHTHTYTDLCGLQDEVMDDDLLLIGKAESVFADECDSEGLAVHGFLSAGPVHKLILRLMCNTGRIRGLTRLSNEYIPEMSHKKCF